MPSFSLTHQPRLRVLLWFGAAAAVSNYFFYSLLIYLSGSNSNRKPQFVEHIILTRLKELNETTIFSMVPKSPARRIRVKRIETTSPSSKVVITSAGMETTTVYENTANNSIISTTGTLSAFGARTERTRKNLIKCPGRPPDLGPIADRAIDITDDLELMFIEMVPGGIYKPKNCLARQSVAIIVPYFNQASMFPLSSFLYILHPFLIKQQLDYRIFVVQAANKSDVFVSRGMLMNIGFTVANSARKDWDCFVFHNPLLMPTDSRNLYRCGPMPLQLVSAVSNFAYRNGGYESVTVANRKSSLIKIHFGGVIAMTKKIFLNVNGFSNGFWSNDNDFEDMRLRLKVANYQYKRKIGVYAHYIRFINLNPTPAPYYYEKEPLFSSKRPRRYLQDGVASLPYHQQTIVSKHLYTLVTVDDSLPRKE